MTAEPYCLAMVLCDGVHQDPGTRKFTLLGTFSAFGARDFPAKIKLCVYLAVTDGLGPVKLQIRLVDARSGIIDEGSESQSLFEIESEVDFKDPLMVMEIAVGMAAVIPDGGLYHCELLANRTPLMSRRFIAKRIATKGEDK